MKLPPTLTPAELKDAPIVRRIQILKVMGGVEIIDTYTKGAISIEWEELDTPGKLCAVLLVLSRERWNRADVFYELAAMCVEQFHYPIVFPEVQEVKK